VNRIFQIGGPQAIAAMAYGTQSVPRVDKVVGPGNVYVVTAKKLIFGQVGIDSLAGPSELAYWAQMQGVYQHFGLPMPLVQPRLAATILDSPSSRFLARHDLPFEDLQQHDEAALNRLLEAGLPSSVEASLEQALAGVRELMAAVVEAVPAIDPTLAGAGKTTLGRMEHDLRTLHGKIIHAAKRRDETLRRQFIRAQSQAFPDGHLQERTVGSIFFVNRYGPAIHQHVLPELPLDPGVHWLVTV